MPTAVKDGASSAHIKNQSGFGAQEGRYWAILFALPRVEGFDLVQIFQESARRQSKTCQSHSSTACSAKSNKDYSRESEIGTKRTSRDVRSLVAIGGKAEMAVASADFRV